MVMESWNEICTCIASHRAMITFEQAGVATFGEMRRVPIPSRSCTDERTRSRACTGGCCGPPRGPDEISIDTSSDHAREHASAGFLD
jgi:hypothetical protein